MIKGHFKICAVEIPGNPSGLSNKNSNGQARAGNEKNLRGNWVLNPRSSDFDHFALPTELQGLADRREAAGGIKLKISICN